MTRRAWLLVDVLSRALTPDEREAVRGDLEEAGETGVSAVREVLGLVLRRQAATWMDWRPWIAVGTIVAPVGVALSHLSAFWAGGTAIYSWLYIDNWTWGYLQSPGARHEIAWTLVGFGLNYFTLAGWAWTSGYGLRSLSPATTWLTVTLLSVVTFVGTGHLTVGSAYPNGSAVFSFTFYRAIAPVLLRMVLIVFPVWWGAHRRSHSSASRVRTVILAIVMGLLTARTFPGLSMEILVSPRTLPIPASASWPYQLLGLALLWPTILLVSTALRRNDDRTSVVG
jgi:hypothetical protein